MASVPPLTPQQAFALTQSGRWPGMNPVPAPMMDTSMAQPLPVDMRRQMMVNSLRNINGNPVSVPPEQRAVIVPGQGVRG